jgi:hypothetical protein
MYRRDEVSELQSAQSPALPEHKVLIPTKERQEDLRVPLFFPERRAGVSRCTAALAHSVPNRQQVPITCGTRLFKPDGLLRRRYLSCDAMDADSAVSH